MAEPRPVKTGGRPALILTGPTGVGKTAVAVELALRHGYGLISADSMQVYRGMGIGTAQPTAAELRGVPILGCGMIEPTGTFSAQRFLDFCAEAHAAVEADGRVPLYVGGTGLYLRALRWGLFKETSTSADKGEAGPVCVRRRLQAEARDAGLETLHKRIQAADPHYAARISPRDEIRIIRALEVLERTGRPMSELQSQWAAAEPRFAHTLVVLNCPRPVLSQRIERRVGEMLEAGWVEEVRSLLEGGVDPASHAFKALGYRDIAAMLGGEIDATEMRDRITTATRKFAKRQMTWFRGERGAVWVDYDGVSLEGAVSGVEKVLDLQSTGT